MDTVPVYGRVTYGGGDWPKPGKITFAAVKATGAQGLHPGSADFGTDGRFSVVKSSQSEGLAPGEYTVTVECWETPPSMDNPGGEKSYVPVKYQNGRTSDLKLVIEPDKRKVEFNANVPKE